MATSEERHVNYDGIAGTYDRRYVANAFHGIADAVRAEVGSLNASVPGAGVPGTGQASEPRRVLEAGCGTGRWLNELQPLVGTIYGLDFSLGMLRQVPRPVPRPAAQPAQGQAGTIELAQGHALRLPYAAGTFDLLFCVNALHHFGDPVAFIAEARRVLRPGGRLLIVNLDPAPERCHWYLYDYFAGMRERDLARYPTVGQIVEWLRTAGFDPGEWRVAERTQQQWTGAEVLRDPFLAKDSTSQLVLLSDAEYQAGVERIRAAIARAEAEGGEVRFAIDLSLVMVAARRS